MRGWLRQLDESEPASSPTVPNAWDEEVARGVMAYAVAPAAEKRGIRAEMTEDRSWALIAFGHRMAEAAVRADDPRLVVTGLVAMSLVELGDVRDALRVFPLLRHSAAVLGQEPRALFDEAAALTDEPGAEWLGQLRDEPFGPRDMGFVVHGQGATFEYRLDQRGPPDYDARIAALGGVEPSPDAWRLLVDGGPGQQAVERAQRDGPPGGSPTRGRQR